MENTDALRLLAKALKSRRSMEAQPIDESGLPALPDFRSDNPSMPPMTIPAFPDQPEATPPNQNDLLLKGLSDILRNRKIQGNIGDLQYTAGTKNINTNFPIGDATIKAMLGYDGGMSLNANAPIHNGNVNFDASRGEDGNRKFYLRLNKAF